LIAAFTGELDGDGGQRHKIQAPEPPKKKKMWPIGEEEDSEGLTGYEEFADKEAGDNVP
jgi:hypothetical protein